MGSDQRKIALKIIQAAVGPHFAEARKVTAVVVHSEGSGAIKAPS